MSLSTILFLFLTQLGIGIVFTLLLASRETGVKFFRFNAGMALTLIAIGVVFRPAGLASAGAPDALALWALVAAAGALLIYWTTVGRGLRRLQAILLPAAALAGVVAVWGQAIGAAPPTFTMQVMTVLSFITSAALLGGACTSMVLGHWYLVLPSMDVSHLQSMVKFHIGSLAARFVLVAAAVALAFTLWQPGTGPAFDRYVFSVSGIFFWQRVLFGLCGPALLAYLTWETAKIQSTQSATGILYVDFFTVIVGEVLAKYLLLATKVPV